MKIVIYLILFSIAYGCGNNVSNEESSIAEQKEIIKLKEDSLAGLQNAKKDIPLSKHHELIASLLDFYTRFPKDEYAPVCLDKVHMSYSAMGVYHRAAEYADILIKKYPKYINRPMILESQASNYDIFIQPRDTSKVKYYYNLLLKENLKMDKDKKAGIQMRLKHLDLNFDEYIEFMMKEETIK